MNKHFDFWGFLLSFSGIFVFAVVIFVFVAIAIFSSGGSFDDFINYFVCGGDYIEA